MLTVLAALSLATTPEVSAWVVSYNPDSIKRFEARARQLNTVFVDYYTVDASGLPMRRAGNAETYKKAREIAKKNKVQFFVMINNYAEGKGEDGFDPVRMTKAFATNESRTALATGIVKMLKQDKAEGIDLDLESMKGTDRDGYSAFAATLSSLLHAEKMKLSITVHPKEEAVGGWEGTKSQDYKALGAAADRFNVMTYDFSWSTSPAGAIAPTAWVERVITFTKTQVPTNKIGLGIACYGYDWSKKPASSLTFTDFNSKNPIPDPESGEMIDGKIHFSGANAFQQKYQLAKKLGIASVAFWYCGSEDPAIWKLLPIRH